MIIAAVILMGAIMILGGATVYAGRKFGWEEVLLPAIMLAVVVLGLGLVWVAVGTMSPSVFPR